MRITARHPALVYGRVKRMTGDKLVYCMPEVEAEVAECSAADAPVAALVRTHSDERLEYRTYNGRMYIRKWNSLGGPARAGTGGTTHLTDFFDGFDRDIQEIIGRNTAPLATRPERLWRTLSYRSDQHELKQSAAQDADNLVPSPRTDGDLARWRDRAMERLSGMLLVDGEFWQASGEPCYRVGSYGTVDAEDTLAFIVSAQPESEKDYFWRGLSDRYFAAEDLKGVSEYLRRIDADAPVDMERITVLIPDAFKHDVAALEMDRVARAFVSRFQEHFKRAATATPEGAYALPGEFLRSVAGLRDAARGRHVLDPVDEALAMAVEEFVRVAGRHPGLLEDMHFEDMPVVEDILTSWEDMTPVRTLAGPAFG